MTQLYSFLVQFAPWILGACALSFLWNFVRMLRQQGKMRTAYYFLERDKAEKARDRSLWMMMLALLIAGLVMFVNLRIVPSLPDGWNEPAVPTPQSTFSVTSPDNAGINIANSATLIPFPTSTPVIAPTATLGNPSDANTVLRPVAQPTRPTLDVDPIYDGCTADVTIEQPPSGTTLSEGVSLFGRAVADAFDYYIVQINGPETAGTWVDLIDGTVNSPVENGFLGSGRLTDWENGVYQIELTIVDDNGDTAGSCRIQIGILQ